MTSPDHPVPGVHRILAPNPSPMTERGTNTYLVGESRLAVIDPGPMLDPHLDALLAAINGRPVEAILVTHAHIDHSPLAAPLSEATGAPVMAFGDAQAGRSAIMTELAAAGLTDGGEGVHADFRPDVTLADGEVISGPDWTLEAIWTPGHFGNHLSFAYGDALFSGDLIMGWASSLVSPPDGDLTDFMASCRRLAKRDWDLLLPGHGAPVTDPAARIAWLLDHRKGRETQILTALRTPMDLPSLTRSVYVDVQPMMLPAAERNVLAHLIDLVGRDLVCADPRLSASAVFCRKE